MSTIETLAQALTEELQEFEFSSLQIGAMLPADLAEEDEGIRDQIGAPRSDRLKAAIVKSMSGAFPEEVGMPRSDLYGPSSVQVQLHRA